MMRRLVGISLVSLLIAGLWGFLRLQNIAVPVSQHCLQSENSFSCYERTIKTLVREEGTDVALRYTQGLLTNKHITLSACHDLTHTAGRTFFELYQRSKRISVSALTDLCGYGFFHGLSETMAARTVKPEIAEKVCLEIEERNSQANCFHGIGHGAAAGHEQEYWGNAQKMIEKGISVCLHISPKPEYQQTCMIGVYNGVATYAFNREYGLQLPDASPFMWCAGQPDSYRQYCYEGMAVASWLMTEDFSQAAVYISGIPDKAGAERAIGQLTGSYIINTHPACSVAQIIDPCLGISDTLRPVCVTGMITSLSLYDKSCASTDFISSVCSYERLSSSEQLFCRQKALLLSEQKLTK